MSEYSPRAHFEGFRNRNKRWSVIVAHRRAGKTVACIRDLLTRALATKKTAARFAYIAPYYSQAKQTAWDYLKLYSRDLAAKVSESELSVELFNGSRIRLYGADNPDALRGIYLDGCVMDEFADMRPSVWGEIIRPLLADRKGWAVFIGTPKGRNAFFELYQSAKDDPDWFALVLRASETGLIDAAELADAKKAMSDSQYEQEFECSFEAAIIGSVYGKDITRARSAGRIGRVPWEPSKLVFTAFDIGYGDSTAIWFWQVMGNEPRFIDFYESNGEPITHYLGVLKRKEYNYDTLWLPHDAETNGKFATGKSIAEIVRENGFKVRIAPNLSLEEGINQGRLLLARALIDEKLCTAGIEALASYRWDYNERLDELKSIPVHDWASHASDAWRYAAVSMRVADQKPKAIKYDLRGYV
jgi:phage terminase large subunit